MGSCFLLNCDPAKRSGLVETANDERKIALRRQLDCLALNQIATVVREGQRLLESKVWQMAGARIGARIAGEVAGHVFKELPAGCVKAFREQAGGQACPAATEGTHRAGGIGGKK